MFGHIPGRPLTDAQLIRFHSKTGSFLTLMLEHCLQTLTSQLLLVSPSQRITGPSSDWMSTPISKVVLPLEEQTKS